MTAYRLNGGLAGAKSGGKKSLIEHNEVSRICLAPSATYTCHTRRPLQVSVHQHQHFRPAVVPHQSRYVKVYKSDWS